MTTILGFSRGTELLNYLCIIMQGDLLGRPAGSEVRAHSSHLRIGEREDSAAAQLNKVEATELEGFRMTYQSKAKGGEAQGTVPALTFH